MTHILILESNTPDRVAKGMADAQPLLRTLPDLAEGVELSVAEPYATPLDPGLLADVDGVIFTGSGVDWCVDDPRATPLVDAMRLAFAAGVPVWGSCNGMQLAAVVLGGQCGASPNGREDGLARDIALTPEGRDHPMMEGRRDGFAVACVHRDEVTALPEGATLLAANAHSPVQAFAYDRDGVDFWGVQYHPEYSGPHVAVSLRSRPGLEQMAADLEQVEQDADAASRLGIGATALSLRERATELGNWITHLRGRG